MSLMFDCPPDFRGLLDSVQEARKRENEMIEYFYGDETIEYFYSDVIIDPLSREAMGLIGKEVYAS